ncbi:hypothetical protein MMC07_009482 [Pseudocyphellaria aurata]|nr:hypothetical protein [Pseudocyphellaria aurata]
MMKTNRYFLTYTCCISSFLLFAQGTVPSPKASTDLICHTNHASECYPRTFQPTTQFQTVHDDQNLPPGLHIRINLATGIKEAKLNEPDSAQGSQAAGLVIIDDVPHGPPELRDQSKPQDYSSQRHPQFDPSEGSVFASSVDDLKASPSHSSTVIHALASLEDLAHSQHWGLTLARDSTLSHILFQMLAPVASDSQTSLEIQSAAALLLATAIHNNPAALEAALSHFYNDEWATGPLEAAVLALADERLSSLSTRMVFLLSALCQDETQLWKLVDARGLDLLAQVFDAENAGSDGNDRLRGKIANFMVDRLLQLDETTKKPWPLSQDDGERQKEPELDMSSEITDSWVMIHDNMRLRSPEEADSETGFTWVADLFKPWCLLFEKSSRQLSGRGADNESARAHENIHDAQVALDRKLNFYGSGCSGDYRNR